MIKDRHHDALTCLLRDADPAAGDARLDAVERARLRLAITETADQHASGGLWAGGRQGWMRPALAVAAVVAVVGLALATLDRNNTTPESVTDRNLETPALITTLDPAAGRATSEVEPGAPTSPELAPTTTPVAPPENTTTAPANDPPLPDKQARTVQFTAPRGTRVIWTLDPNFEFPIAEREARQEQAQ